MRKNNLYTKSYFIKRLLEAGYFVTRVVDRYNDDDTRYWSISVMERNECNRAMITCIKPDEGFYFRVNGPNDTNIKLETLSMNIVCETIERLFGGIDVLKISLED